MLPFPPINFPPHPLPSVPGMVPCLPCANLLHVRARRGEGRSCRRGEAEISRGPNHGLRFSSLQSLLLVALQATDPQYPRPTPPHTHRKRRGPAVGAPRSCLGRTRCDKLPPSPPPTTTPVFSSSSLEQHAKLQGTGAHSRREALSRHGHHPTVDRQANI